MELSFASDWHAGNALKRFAGAKFLNSCAYFLKLRELASGAKLNTKCRCQWYLSAIKLKLSHEGPISLRSILVVPLKELIFNQDYS